MKKLLFTLVCFTLLAFVVSCSESDPANDSVLYNSNTAFSVKTGSVFDGVIGEIRGGENVVTAAPGPILQEFENALISEGISDDLTTLAIVRKTATNNPGHQAYFLIASGAGHTTTASVSLELSSNYFFAEKPVDGDRQKIICRGCAQGCLFSYLTIDGVKIPYCNELACSQYDCREIRK